MKQVYKDFIKVLKVFLITGVGFAITKTFFDFLIGYNFHLLSFLLNMFLFGGIMSLFAVSIHQAELKKRGLEDKDIKLVNKKVVRSKMSLDNLLEKIKKAYFFERHRIKKIDGGIELNSNMTGIAWGERMTIKCHKLEDGVNEFEIVSKPRMRFTLLDGGANYENATMIENLLEK